MEEKRAWLKASQWEFYYQWVNVIVVHNRLLYIVYGKDHVSCFTEVNNTLKKVPFFKFEEIFLKGAAGQS